MNLMNKQCINNFKCHWRLTCTRTKTPSQNDGAPALSISQLSKCPISFGQEWSFSVSDFVSQYF
uniref:Uncharacterized protein n=1 Tax=Anguilla anguilla TaxID=7936 RepID=A0A0E9W7E8_ANGAN